MFTMILPADLFFVVAAPFVGSFVATLALRLPAGMPVVAARSACPGCGAILSPLSLVPVVSWVAQRGRCRNCRGAISPAYPAVETAAFIIALWAATVVSGWLLAVSCLLGWTLLALALIDGRHFILPDILTLPLLISGFFVTYFIDPNLLPDRLIASATAFATLAAIAALYRIVRGREGLGLGDAKLLAAGGVWVGLAGLPGVLLIGCFTALAWAMLQGIKSRRIAPDLRVAFGPFLALGIWLVWIYGPLEIRWPF